MWSIVVWGIDTSDTTFRNLTLLLLLGKRFGDAEYIDPMNRTEQTENIL